MSKIGDTAYNNKGLLMTIVEYRDNKDIDVMFEDGFVKKNI